MLMALNSSIWLLVQVALSMSYSLPKKLCSYGPI